MDSGLSFLNKFATQLSSFDLSIPPSVSVLPNSLDSHMQKVLYFIILGKTSLSNLYQSSGLVQFDFAKASSQKLFYCPVDLHSAKNVTAYIIFNFINLLHVLPFWHQKTEHVSSAHAYIFSSSNLVIEDSFQLHMTALSGFLYFTAISCQQLIRNDKIVTIYSLQII